MIRFRDAAEVERFFGLPEGSVVETTEPLRYEIKTPLPTFGFRTPGEQESDGPSPTESDGL